jgi:hypothetical protein
VTPTPFFSTGDPDVQRNAGRDRRDKPTACVTSVTLPATPERDIQRDKRDILLRHAVTL